jgi:hypothetical protein
VPSYGLGGNRCHQSALSYSCPARQSLLIMSAMTFVICCWRACMETPRAASLPGRHCSTTCSCVHRQCPLKPVTPLCLTSTFDVPHCVLVLVLTLFSQFSVLRVTFSFFYSMVWVRWVGVGVVGGCVSCMYMFGAWVYCIYIWLVSWWVSGLWVGCGFH